jgi:hypothetical protein
MACYLFVCRLFIDWALVVDSVLHCQVTPPSSARRACLTLVLHSRPMNLDAFFFGYFWFSSACGGRET